MSPLPPAFSGNIGPCSSHSHSRKSSVVSSERDERSANLQPSALEDERAQRECNFAGWPQLLSRFRRFQLSNVHFYGRKGVIHHGCELFFPPPGILRGLRDNADCDPSRFREQASVRRRKESMYRAFRLACLLRLFVAVPVHETRRRRNETS